MVAEESFGPQAFISVECPQVQPRREVTIYSHGIIFKLAADINMTESSMQNTVLLKTCFLKNVQLENAYVYYLKKPKQLLTVLKPRMIFNFIKSH